MSATKIAASFRVSLTALMPRSPDRRVAGAWAWLHYHAALRKTWKQGMQAPRVDWPVYPRRVELITHAKGGNRQLADFSAAEAVSNRPAEADPKALARAPLFRGGYRHYRSGTRLIRTSAAGVTPAVA
jgi:hypothetical protein